MQPVSRYISCRLRAQPARLAVITWLLLRDAASHLHSHLISTTAFCPKRCHTVLSLRFHLYQLPSFAQPPSSKSGYKTRECCKNCNYNAITWTKCWLFDLYLIFIHSFIQVCIQKCCAFHIYYSLSKFLEQCCGYTVIAELRCIANNVIITHYCH